MNLPLKTNQFAFSADGALAAFNGIRHHLSLHPEHVCVATVGKGNAFEQVSQAEMRKQLLAEMPTFLPYFELLYGEAASLFYEGRELESRHGCQQGCAWGTLLYALADRRRMADLIAAHPAVVFVQFVDDIFMLGEPAAVAAAFADWEAATLAAGEQPNVSKCAGWSPSPKI